MALTKEKKQKILNDLKEKIANQKSIVFADFSKVNSKDLFKLRRQLKEAGCALKIGKKTLTRIAFGQSNLSFWDKIKKVTTGQLALVLGIDDELTPIKISSQFAKVNENFKILGGIFENRFIEKDKIMELAAIPSKNELLAKLVGMLSFPILGFENVLIANTRSLVLILSKVKNLESRS